MDIVAHILLGLLMAYIGLLPPGMINMTVVRTTLRYGRMSAIEFSAGAALVVALQSSVALVFAGYFYSHPAVLEKLTFAGGLVLLLLSGFFFQLGRKHFKGQGRERTGNFFIAGLGMSVLNMLAIPFYLGWSTFLSMNGWIQLEQPFISYFVLGAAIGAFLLCVSYSYFANVIEVRAQFIARNINFILSGLFLVLGGGTLARLFF